MKQKLAFIGFGVVGQGLAEILLNSQEDLRVKNKFEFEVVAISDKIKGSIYDPNGLDLQRIIDTIKQSGNLSGYTNAVETGWDSITTIEKSNADIIIEVSWTDLKTGEPAISHVKTALALGKHVVLTNKGPIALFVNELLELAKVNHAELRFEGTVLAGTPAINLGMHNLAGSGTTEIQGILNGTTNYILSEMEKGMDYVTALKQAQELGYAEADPSGDVEGWDAVGKIVILTNIMMGKTISMDDVDRTGITKISPSDIEMAKNENKRWKLIGTTKILPDGSIQASVKPEMIPLSEPLASVMGPTNALMFRTKYLGDVTIVGPGAGKLATGFALLSDLLDINRLIRYKE
ncbi:MAG: homoserine dehydrogenase [Candidatus Kariarchaeaceae archaeon]|jgi:homoserine dehydrogenase